MPIKIIVEIVVASITSIAFSLLVVLAALRLRSRESVIFHLTLYVTFGLITSLSLLMIALAVLPLPGLAYQETTRITLLVMILSFGALTLNFLKKDKNKLIGYWVGAAIIMIAWAIFKFNFLGWGTIVAAQVGISDWEIQKGLAGLGWVTAIITALVSLTLDFRKKQPLQYLNRLRYWLIATALLSVSGLVWFISPLIFGWAGLLLLTGGAMLVGYVVLSYHTPDLKILVGRATRYAGVTAILAALFFAGLAVVITLSRRIPNATTVLVWAIVVAIIFANLFPIIWRISNRLLTGIIFGRQRHDQKRVIKLYSQSISSALDMKRLGDTLIKLMIETLGIQKGIVFVNDRGGDGGDAALRPLSSIGATETVAIHFSTDSPFLDYFRQGKKKSISQYDIEVMPQFRLLSEETRQWFNDMGMELYVPILRERELAGLLAFGPQSQGTAYYDEDLDLMVAMADQAALALDSTRLFEQLATINQEVGTLNQQLAGIDETKSDFLSIASHELRTPLTHIHGYSRMLLDLTEEELKDPAYLKTLIEGVVKGSDRMKDVVDVMFDVTEANVGEMSLFAGPVNLEDVVEQASVQFLTVLDERRIAFGKDGVKDLPIIEADGTRLVQAIENLLGNAIKYTPDGGTIKIEGRPIVLDNIGSAVELIVSDSGIGIDPEFHERIFEKFFRIDDTMHHSTGKTKFKGAGPGLGLTLILGIAEAHGGNAWVESLGHDEVNCPGSQFYLVIPLHPIIPGDDDEDSVKQSQIETRHWRRSDSEAKEK